MDNEEFQAMAAEVINAHVAAQEIDEASLRSFLARLSYVAVDATSDEGWSDLASVLAPGTDRVRVFYLATSPDLFGPIAEPIGKANLVTPLTRVVLEKPIGRDLASARRLNEVTGRTF